MSLVPVDLPDRRALYRLPYPDSREDPVPKETEAYPRSFHPPSLGKIQETIIHLR